MIDRLAENGIDLTKMPVEVAPIAHYHMGGTVADDRMMTEVPGLLVAGEAVGGANGANRLSGNAITEAFVFGRKRRPHAPPIAPRAWTGSRSRPRQQRATLDLLASTVDRRDINTAAMLASACRTRWRTMSARSEPTRSSSAH